MRIEAASRARLSRRALLRAGGVLALAAGCRNGPLSAPAVDEDAVVPDGPFALAGALVYRHGSFAPATVTVEAGRILDIDERAGDDAERVDVSGLWLVPGFIDAHVHLQFSGGNEILAGGVTTVRDLGSPPDVADDIGLRTPLRVLTAGRILTPVGGYPSRSWGSDGTSREVRDVADARDAVREQRAAGASIVKVALEPTSGPLFPPEVLDAIVTGARAAGLAVTAHVGAPEALELAVAHGVAELAHLPLYDVDPDEMAVVAEAGMVLVPTLEIRGRDIAAVRAVAAFREAGGTVVYGTDLGNTGTAPGIETAELRALLDAGMTPAAVLDTATSGAADHLGMTDVGRIEAGAVADLVGLRRDPFDDVTAYDDIGLVVAGGARVVG